MKSYSVDFKSIIDWVREYISDAEIVGYLDKDEVMEEIGEDSFIEYFGVEVKE